jgi:hypothetical protein
LTAPSPAGFHWRQQRGNGLDFLFHFNLALEEVFLGHRPALIWAEKKPVSAFQN